jgi:hypothetical protein
LKSGAIFTLQKRLLFGEYVLEVAVPYLRYDLLLPSQWVQNNLLIQSGVGKDWQVIITSRKSN